MTNGEHVDWLKFIYKLEEVNGTEDRETRLQFLRTFKEQIVLLSFWLNNLRVAGGEFALASDAISMCNLCGTDLWENGLVVDGETKAGPWAYMCLSCFGQQGLGVGWGVGQLFRLFPSDGESNPGWACIAGGNPVPDTGV